MSNAEKLLDLDKTIYYRLLCVSRVDGTEFPFDICKGKVIDLVNYARDPSIIEIRKNYDYYIIKRYVKF